jgi:hypothetical protein
MWRKLHIVNIHIDRSEGGSAIHYGAAAESNGNRARHGNVYRASHGNSSLGISVE